MGTPANIRISLILPETRVTGLHFCHWLYGSTFIQIFEVGSEIASFLQQSVYRLFKVIQGRWLWHQSKDVCNFLLVNSNWSYLAPFLRYNDLLAENCEFFLPHSPLTPSLGVNPFEFPDEFFIPKTRVLGLSVGKDFVILACVVFAQCQRVTDRRTDIPIVANTGLA